MKVHWFLSVAVLAASAVVGTAQSLRLEEPLRPGAHYHVSTRVRLSGNLSAPAEKDRPAAKPVEIRGESAIDYDERVLETETDGQVRKTARIYRRVDLQRTLGGQAQQSTLRPEARRLVVMRVDGREVPFSPDAALTWGEIDLIRTDVFTPALSGLLPTGAVRIGDRWTASTQAVRELTDLEVIDEGSLTCTLESVVATNGRQQARITLTGSVRGTNEDGPNRQVLDGFLYFDVEGRHLSYLSLKGAHVLLDKDGREQGRIEGIFTLTRHATPIVQELTDAAFRQGKLEPDAMNTRLLYDNTDLGIRFLYPRRWRVAVHRGKQVGVDGPDGSGLLLTVEEPNKVPSAGAFMQESLEYLRAQKAKIVREEAPRALDVGIDQFAIEAEVNGQRIVMAYFVVRQGRSGVTVAARLLPRDRVEAQREVEAIARSITLVAR